MPFYICVDTPDGERVCFHIPVLIRKFRPGPDPDPRLDAVLDIFGPHPEPWILDQRLDQQVIRDMEVVAALDSVVTHASPRISEVMQDALQRITADLPLPAGMTLHQEQRG
jgi:hypothetical protein